MTADSSVHRVYATFDSLEEFKEKIGPSSPNSVAIWITQSKPTGTSREDGHLPITTPSPSLRPSTPSPPISALTSSLAARLNSTS